MSERPISSQRVDADELTRQGDELTERLIERREKLNYFLVTASVTVAAFALNDVLSQPSRFDGLRRELVIAGCAALVLAAGSSLVAVLLRHKLSWAYIEAHKYRTLDASVGETKMGEVQKKLGIAAWVTAILFGLGLAVLASGYLWAIASAA